MHKDFHVSLDLSTELEPSKEGNFFWLVFFLGSFYNHVQLFL